jgi:hypothetical protein
LSVDGDGEYQGEPLATAPYVSPESGVAKAGSFSVCMSFAEFLGEWERFFGSVTMIHDACDLNWR